MLPLACLFLFLLPSLSFAQDTTDEYPYLSGPFELKDWPDYTGATNPLRGQVWMRMNEARNRMQLKYTMEAGHSRTPYWPFFAMHVHWGEIKEGNDPAPIAISIAGRYDLWVSVSPSDTESICSGECLPDAAGCNSNCAPPILGAIVGYAYACDGGCDGDERDGDNGKNLVPSRYCDLDSDNPSNPLQNVWIQGRYSVEASGNSTDEGYNPHSIFKRGNFEKWCGIDLEFLPEIFGEGQHAYVALHTNYNSTGVIDLTYGTLLAYVNDGSGVKWEKAQPSPTPKPCDCPEPTKCSGDESTRKSSAASMLRPSALSSLLVLFLLLAYIAL